MYSKEVKMRYVHHIGGRLRLKFPELKNQALLAKSVEQAIRRYPTVRLVQVNAVTGSVLIHYDACGKEQVALLDSIEDALANQFSLKLPDRNVSKADAPFPVSQHHPVADKIVDIMIEKIVERSALALFGVLF
jgi:hypothetical protein